jgi:hypothetical protein
MALAADASRDQSIALEIEQAVDLYTMTLIYA